MMTTQFEDKKFDVIVFRDLLEHVTNPAEFLSKVGSLLNDFGLVFFITPNGLEDFWATNQRWKHGQSETLWLLNHINFFLPQTLDALMQSAGLKRHKGFKYGLKRYKKGYGVLDFEGFPEEALPDIPSKTVPLMDIWKHDPKEIKSKILHNGSFLSHLYMGFHEQETQQVPFDAPHGHEFFVIGEKA
jgi:SAM-dependent methyltransferase